MKIVLQKGITAKCHPSMPSPGSAVTQGLAVFESEAIMRYAGNAGRLQSRVDARGETRGCREFCFSGLRDYRPENRGGIYDRLAGNSLRGCSLWARPARGPGEGFLRPCLRQT